MFWDNHMHCSFSGDSDTPPIEMIAAAKAKGLQGMTFTDHLDIDYPTKYGFFDLDLEHYYPDQHALADAQSDDNFTVLTGIEIGIQPHIAKQADDVIKSFPFDFVIGSTHIVDRMDPYFDDFWEQGDTEKLLKRYYEFILENITAFTNFDSIGHLDYCFRYARDEKYKSDTHKPYADIVDAILQKLVKMDKALEVNTAALRKGMPYPNPAPSIIKRFRELGGQMITIGADAHEPKDIAADFEILPDLLAECSFNEYVVFKKRKPEAYPLR